MLKRSHTFLRNINPFLNRFSPFANSACLDQVHEAGSFEDQYFGYGWDVAVREGDAVYGVTDHFVSGPLDDLATAGFSRLPYRRIPRIKINSLSALQAFVGRTQLRRDNHSAMWRGQAKERCLQRSEAEFRKLYGASVKEPSLIPSASRPGEPPFETYMEAWFGLIDQYVAARLSYLSSIYPPVRIEGLRAEAETWRNSYEFKMWSFAAAQHYGLPSPGLDLTTDIDVATFFALHRFTPAGGGRVDIHRVDASAAPVIYFMGIFDSDLLIDEDIGPSWLQTPRARAQSAHFFGTAWGSASNRAAERIVAVLELHDHASWSLPELRPKLFPSKFDDPFAEFLASVSTSYSAMARFVPIDRVYYWA